MSMGQRGPMHGQGTKALPSSLMLLCVSSGGEPGMVGGGQGRVGAFAAFEFAQSGRFCSDAYCGLDQSGSSLVPEVSKVLGRGRGRTDPEPDSTH